MQDATVMVSNDRIKYDLSKALAKLSMYYVANNTSQNVESEVLSFSPKQFIRGQ